VLGLGPELDLAMAPGREQLAAAVRQAVSSRW
jgi:hypothetical protein